MSRSRCILAILSTAALVAVPLSTVPSFVGLDAAYAKNGGEKGGGGQNGGGEKGGGERGKSGEKGAGGSSGASGAGGASKSAASGAKPGKKPAAAETTATAMAAAPKKGKLASELKGLNAAHASAQAFANASDNSRVGRIRAYSEAYGVQSARSAEAEAAAAEAARLAGLTPDEIAVEFPDPVGYDQAAYDAALAEAQAAAAASGDLSAVETLQALTPEERAATYPSTWDPDVAYSEALTAAMEAEALAAADAAAAEALADAALAAAGGADLSPEALDYLHDLLEGKVPAADEAVVEEVAAGVPVVE